MFEKKHDPLAPLPKFFLRVILGVLCGTAIIAISIFIGMEGLIVYESMSWTDSFTNASMIISGVGAITPIITQTGKIFSALYSVVGNIIFMSVIAIIFSPIIHRWFHKFHLDGNTK